MKKLICIVCPIGCHLTIDDLLNVTGNKCPRGIPYAIEELTHPMRTLTTTVKTMDKVNPRLSVKSHIPLPKHLIFDAMRQLDGILIRNDVKIGDIVIKNILNTGADIVATKTMSVHASGGS